MDGFGSVLCVVVCGLVYIHSLYRAYLCLEQYVVCVCEQYVVCVCVCVWSSMWCVCEQYVCLFISLSSLPFLSLHNQAQNQTVSFQHTHCHSDITVGACGCVGVCVCIVICCRIST